MNEQEEKLLFPQNFDIKVIVAAIIHGSKAHIPNGSSVIEEGDHVIVITAAGRLNDLDSIIEGSAG